MLLHGCDIGISGNGKVKEKAWPVEEFNAIKASGALDIIIRQDGNYKAMVKADENLHEYIEVYVRNGTLHLNTTRNIRNARAKEVYLSVGDLEDIDLSGATEVKSVGTLKANKLKLECSGASELDLELEVEDLRSSLSGASQITLKGMAKEVDIQASGASELEWFEFEIEELSLEASGACDAEVFVTKSLKVELSGASELEYKGQPKLEKSAISGASSIENID